MFVVGTLPKPRETEEKDRDTRKKVCLRIIFLPSVLCSHANPPFPLLRVRTTSPIVKDSEEGSSTVGTLAGAATSSFDKFSEAPFSRTRS